MLYSHSGLKLFLPYKERVGSCLQTCGSLATEHRQAIDALVICHEEGFWQVSQLFSFQFPVDQECPEGRPISTEAVRQKCPFQRERGLLSHTVSGKLADIPVTSVFS